MPIRQPTAVPRIAAGAARRTSSRVGHIRSLAVETGRRSVHPQVGDDFSEAEDADADRDEVDAVHQRRQVEREAPVAGIDIDADDAEQKPDEHHGERLEDRAVGNDHGADQAERHQGTVLRRAERLADFGHGGAARRITRVETMPPNRETSAAMVSAGPARPCCAMT